MRVYFYRSPCDPQTAVAITSLQQLVEAIKADIECEEDQLEEGSDPKIAFTVEFAEMDEDQIEALPEYQGP